VGVEKYLADWCLSLYLSCFFDGIKIPPVIFGVDRHNNMPTGKDWLEHILNSETDLAL
jgi:hypothetical protein